MRTHIGTPAHLQIHVWHSVRIHPDTYEDTYEDAYEYTYKDTYEDAYEYTYRTPKIQSHV